MSRWFSVTSQLLQKLLAPLVSQFSHQAPLSSGNSAPWLSTCVFLQAASINNMLTSPCRSSQRLQASKHLQLFGTHLSITTMNPCWPKLRLPAATWAAETNSLPERWFFFFYTNSVTIWERHLLAGKKIEKLFVNCCQSGRKTHNYQNTLQFLPSGATPTPTTVSSQHLG